MSPVGVFGNNISFIVSFHIGFPTVVLMPKQKPEEYESIIGIKAKFPSGESNQDSFAWFTPNVDSHS